MSDKQTVAVVGASGVVGFPTAAALRRLGHEVIVVSRERTDGNDAKLGQLETAGATLRFGAWVTDVEMLASLIDGADVVINATRASPRTISDTEGTVLRAAMRANLSRVVPSEFGSHTLAVDYGVSGQFDAKKDFQRELFASGLAWTIVYPGGIAEYHLPSLRGVDKVKVFGNLTLSWPTHRLTDIGEITARVATDERTANRAVQVDKFFVTTEQLLQELRSAWPDHPFEVEHVTSKELEQQLATADTNPHGGRLSEREALGINYANRVLGLLGVPDHETTVRATTLYPGFVYADPLELLHDRTFVFERLEV